MGKILAIQTDCVDKLYFARFTLDQHKNQILNKVVFISVVYFYYYLYFLIKIGAELSIIYLAILQCKNPHKTEFICSPTRVFCGGVGDRLKKWFTNASDGRSTNGLPRRSLLLLCSFYLCFKLNLTK